MANERSAQIVPAGPGPARAPGRPGFAGTGNAFTGRSRPLCPCPQHAHDNGSGNPEDAASFECR